MAVRCLVVALLVAAAAPAAAQMPDLSQMNGRSLPAPDAPAGTATVRLMKQTFGNNVVGQDVTLVDGRGTTVGPRKTDASGRASFDGLRVGETYRAVTVVDGERLESQPFTQPPSGGVRVILVAGLGAAAPAAPVASAPAGAQMPDLSQMNGRSLPAPDAPVGTATVRLMKQTFGNNVVGQDVTLVDGRGTTVGPRKTDDGGRASFDGLRVGETYRAVVVMDGERLESQPFTQPPSGGVRVILVAGLGAAPSAGASAPAPAGPAVPAKPGSVVLGTQSRVVIEQEDEFVEVFVLSDLVNTTGGPVSLPAPIVFPLPAGALGAAILEGTTAAALEGGRIVVKGPLPSGPTPVQFGYRLPSDSGTVKVPQVFPVAGPMSTVIVRRGATTAIAVGGERGRRDANLEGRDYIVVSGSAVQAGSPIDVTVSGLPSRSRWPLRIALTLAGLIVFAGVVFGRARADDDGDGDAAAVPARS